MRTASERHQNAVKAITNLLKIVDQARANFAQAKVDIATYTKAHNAALAAQRVAQNNIIAGENKVAQIESAIAGLEGLIDRIRGDLDNAIATRTSLETAKK